MLAGGRGNVTFRAEDAAQLVEFLLSMCEAWAGSQLLHGGMLRHARIWGEGRAYNVSPGKVEAGGSEVKIVLSNK